MIDLELLTIYYEYLRKKKIEGKKIIAFMAHDNIPEELIDAAGFIPLNLIFGGNDELMNSSHDYLPPSTCAFAQSCIGLFSLKPSQFRFLEMIDYFIVSNHCVSNVCAAEVIAKYFDIPRLNFYISYTQNDNALKYYELELLDFKSQLEKIKGTEIKKEEILESIKKYNKFKKLLLEINDLNNGSIKKLNIYQKAMLFGPEIFPEIESLIKNYKNNQFQESNNSKDLILTGCSIFIGDYLIDLVEESGGNIIFFDTWIGSNYFSQIIEDNILNSGKDPIELLTERFKNNIYGDHTVPFYLENKVGQLENIVDDYKQKTGKQLAVINHIIKFCDHISIMSAFLKNTMQERGIQVLNLERDYSRTARGPLETRIQAFLEML